MIVTSYLLRYLWTILSQSYSFVYQICKYRITMDTNKESSIHVQHKSEQDKIYVFTKWENNLFFFNTSTKNINNNNLTNISPCIFYQLYKITCNIIVKKCKNRKKSKTFTRTIGMAHH